MLRRFQFWFGGFLFLAASLFLRAHPQVQVGEAPTWIDKVFEPIDEAAVAPQGSDVYTLLWDRQIEGEKAESYFRNIYKICSSDGVQHNSQISVSFDPEYESIVFHQVIVWRNGVAENRLVGEKIKVLQQESELDRYQYNGRLTALILLEDIRIGDIIEFSYTQRGRNPVLKDHLVAELYTNWTSPVKHEHVRLVTSASRPVHDRLIGAGMFRSVQTKATGVIYDWSVKDVKAVEWEPNTPNWYLPFAKIEISDFNSWADVVAWAEPLYTTDDQITPQIQEKVHQLAAGMSLPSEKAAAILDFVQNEVRYLGIELGEGSHAPSPSQLVFQRRFGDCKDKVRLLCTMLRAADIDAVPALTHSSRKQYINGDLPSPFAFDHVIARISIDGHVRWIDPTIAEQGGTFEQRYIPDYRAALPIEPHSTQISSLELPHANNNEVRVTEHFDSSRIDQPALLQLSVSYIGYAADGMRMYLQSTPIDQVSKGMMNRRVKLYPKLEAVGPPEWKDAKDQNILTITQTYRVPGLWIKSASSPVLEAEFSPLSLSEYFYAPSTVLRTAPYGLPFPLRNVYETTVLLPQHWPIEKRQGTVDDDGFVAESSTDSVDNLVTFKYSYETKKDSVPAVRMAEYAEHLSDYRKLLGHSLTYNPAIAAFNAHFSPNWWYIVSLVGSLLFWSLAAVWFYRCNFGLTYDRPVNQRYRGISGWLLLPAIGVFLRPLLLLNIFRSTIPFFDLRHWEPLNETAKSLLLILSAIHVGLFVLSALTILTFVKKRRLFPILFIFAFFAEVSYGIANAWVAAQISGDSSKLAYTIGLAVGPYVLPAMIWISYMLVSKRVQATFNRNFNSSYMSTVREESVLEEPTRTSSNENASSGWYV